MEIQFGPQVQIPLFDRDRTQEPCIGHSNLCIQNLLLLSISILIADHIPQHRAHLYPFDQFFPRSDFLLSANCRLLVCTRTIRVCRNKCSQIIGGSTKYDLFLFSQIYVKHYVCELSIINSHIKIFVSNVVNLTTKSRRI